MNQKIEDILDSLIVVDSNFDSYIDSTSKQEAHQAIQKLVVEGQIEEVTKVYNNVDSLIVSGAGITSILRSIAGRLKALKESIK